MTKAATTWNAVAITELADFIEQSPELPFGMRSWRRPDPECGTAGCIGAFSDILWGEAVNHSEERLANLLGIGFVAVNNLVYMWNSSFDLPDVTRDDAVAVLRHLANTGKVQWDQVLRNRGKEPVQ